MKKLFQKMICISLAIICLVTLGQVNYADGGMTKKIITVKNVNELMATEKAVKAGHVTVRIEDGTYHLTKGIWIAGENVTFESKSGNRDKVVLTGDFKASHIFWITKDRVTIQNISIGEVKNHAIQVHSEMDADHATIRNVRFFDTKEQMLKGSGSSNKDYSDECLVENCLFEFTKGTAYQYYTGGIFSDQITAEKSPGTFTKEQLAFVAKKMAGTQKISKSFSDQIRKINPNFLVLHYRLGIWQSAVPHITDG